MKLEGIRVLDLSLFLPGPLLTQMMADHGAEVIKLEPINGGEPNREIGLKRDGVSVFFANTHRNKKSIQLNLKTEAGREAALRLAESCDVMIEAFRPGVVDRLGVGYEAVAARHPGIVYASISAFGQDGPYVNRPAHDMATEAYAGILSVNLGPDDRPAIPAIANADMLSSMMGLSAVLMALLRRKDTGQGDYIDLAMMDSVVAAMPNNMGPVFAEKRAPYAKHERSWGGNAMYRMYETKDDKWVVLGGAEMHFAAAILNKMGRPDLIPLCEPPPGPNQDPVKEFLSETFRTRTQAEWCDWFADVDAAFAPLNDLRQGADDPQLRHRQMIVEDERGWEHIGIPMKFRQEPGQLRFELAELGQHTEQVLRGLGYADGDIAAMREDGVF
ncbi:MAG: CaiB/BaiF CoA-transferase family protein [Alphaproteobacteria bacterium]|jgi:crotonobetainyl-CoA:carnitine CoA-transferase CaiB-like acyl-CoA transferase|nr:CaiB/BaiF CoA-transferase family protein [Alphaproteobacteria bacterium]MDP6565445.1 CaiB/BaiF CoA-transferase family protein [Alphaproteobacteria bacterium]MDP6811718.1 CaiB/BaiF CoA-transferase family protein [Alphaproteobacteria bacterium]